VHSTRHTKRVGLSDGRGIKQIHIKSCESVFQDEHSDKEALPPRVGRSQLKRLAIKCGSFGGGKSSVNDCS
jgi:hypothetical protein